jgi:hypothetical protein
MTTYTNPKTVTVQVPAGNSSQSAHSFLVATLGEIVGISILAIFADLSDTVGKVAVAIMCGWLLIFLMSNTSWLNSLIPKL